MKIPLNLNYGLLLGTILFGITSCEQTRKTETNTTITENDTTSVSRTTTRKKPSEELREFRNWVNSKTNKADSSAEKRWPKVKDEFKNRSARLDTRLDSMSEDSKREYAELKSRYQTWEEKQEARSEQPLNENTLNTWRKNLLGERRAYSTITGANARETYLLFMGIVRAKNRSWSLSDWDYVDHVYGELNDRKAQIESNISAADRLKIKTLQAEYLTLEGAADAKDAYKHVREK